MPSIDERVVSMAFENQVFEQRVSQTLTTLTKLDTAVKNIGSATGLENIEKSANKVTLNGPMSALDKLRAKLGRSGEGAAQGFSEIERASNKVTLEGTGRAIDRTQGKLDQLSAGSTFSDIEKASNQVELSGLSRALESVTAKFSILQGAASVALGNIASQATMKGAAFAKSFAFGPLQQGFSEYQTNLKSIQTIMANTQGQQVSGLDATNKYLGELNEYSDKTIYNFGEMAKNIGTFTAAGVDLPKSTEAIKGIANLAALSGSNSQQASTAMYQLSQAIAAGRVGLQDWNSVVNAGMGGAVFQKALMRTAENMGALEKGAVKIDKATGKATVNGESFRNSIMAKPGEESWLTSDVLTNTLSQLTGDMTDAELAAQGFTKEQIKAIQAQAQTATKAATEVKTLPQVFEVARESIGSGWSKTFQLIFGDFNEAKKTFTELSNFINGFIGKVSDARNKILEEWSKLGGRKLLIHGIKEGFDSLFKILGAVRDAFRDIFPAQTGRDLYDLTSNFVDLMAAIKPSPETIDALRRIFAGLFAVVHIGWTVIKELAGAIFDLLGIAGKGSGGFLGFVASIGDFIVAIDKAVTQGGLIKGFFKTLGSIIAVPLKLVISMAKAVASLFGGGDDQTLVEKHDQLVRFGKVLTPAERLVLNLKEAWAKLVGAFEKTKGALEPFFSSFVDKLKNFGTLIGDAFKNLDFDNFMSGLQTGLMAGIFLAIKKVLGKGGPLSEITGVLGGVNELIGAFTGQMEAMQSKLKAQALLAIAGAVAILAAGLFVLSTIDGEDLAKALTATAVGLGQLVAAMKVMTLGGKGLGAVQFTIMAAGLIALAIAVTILAAAMKIFATMSWEEIGKGLTGVAGSISAVGLAMRLMPPTLPITAAGLILIGIALNLIAAAVAAFATMKWDEIGKGLLGVVTALGGIALGVSQMPPTLPIAAAGLILMGIALGLIGGAIKRIGELDMLTIIKGLGTIMAALAGIGVIMTLLMPYQMVMMAAGLVGVGIALNLIGTALKIMGSMDILDIVKGLAAMAGALIVLAVGLTAMSGTLAGSAALMAASLALAVLAPTLAFLGNLDFITIVKGLAAIALVLGTLSVVGLVASAGLVQLGISLIPLAAAFTLAAGGVFLFAKGLALLGAEGGKGIAVMVTALTAFIAMLPTLVIKFVEGLVGILDELVKLAPKVVEGLAKILDTVIAFVAENAPKLAVAINALIEAGLNVLTTNIPKFVAAGVKIVGSLLQGISQNIVQVTAKVTEIVTKFLNTLTAKAPSLTAAGARTLIAFLNGITTQIPKVVAAVANMVIQFLNALTRQIPRIASAGQRMMLTFLTAISNFVPRLVNKGAEIIIKFLDGLGNNVNKIVDKGAELIIKLIQGITRNMNKVADKGADAVIKFLNSLADTIREKGPEILKAGFNIADALIDGVSEGFGIKGPLLKKALDAVFSLIPGWAKKLLGIKSPSTVFAEIGKFTMQGFAKGVSDNNNAPKKAIGDSAISMINEIKRILGVHSPSEVMRNIGKAVGQGFAQGIHGSASDIRGAFKGLKDQLSTDIKTIRDQIKADKEQLEEELSKSRSEQDPKLIQDLGAAIRRNTADLQKLSAARRTMNLGLVAERNRLIALSKQYDKTVEKLDKARQELDRLKGEAESYGKSRVDQYSATPDIDRLVDEAVAEAELTETARQEKIEEIRKKTEARRRIDQVALYKKALQEQIVATIKYNETLQRLRNIGLDDTTYKKLLEKGLEGQEFAEQLLAKGKSGVTEINKLNSQLLAQATNMSGQAVKELYAAGIQAAQGLVDGLKAKKAELAKTMDFMADLMVRSIKRQLKIRSPSEVFAEVGKFISQGLARGLDSSDATVAAAQMGKDTLSAISTAISDSVDVDPVITPVLDLAGVERQAKKLTDLTNVTPITAAVSFGQASAISTEKREVETADQAVQNGTVFQFEQNNYSPEALSDVEIYRQTKNQLGQIKSALGLVT